MPLPDASSAPNAFDGMLRAIAAIDDGGRWTPGIGDPSVMGWVTVGAYLTAAAIALWWAMAAGPARRLVPAGIAAIMLLLAVNKQLDLQSLLTQTARDLLRGTDLYEDRRSLQAIFIGVFAAGGLAVLGAMLWGCRRRLSESGLALAGLAMLLVFVAIRAASFHKVDSGLGQELAGMRLNWILELGGIGLVGAGGLLGRFQNRGRVRGRSRPASHATSADETAVEKETAGTGASSDRTSKLPRIVRSGESDRAPRGPMDGFVVKPIRISDGPAARRSRERRAEESERDEGRGEMGPRRLVP